MEGHRDSKNALESTSECKHARLVHIEQGRQTRSPTASLSLTGSISTSNFARSHASPVLMALIFSGSKQYQ